MTEHGPDWEQVAAGAAVDQAEQAIQTLARAVAAYYLTLRRNGVSTRAAVALTQQWYAMSLARARDE